MTQGGCACFGNALVAVPFLFQEMFMAQSPPFYRKYGFMIVLAVVFSLSFIWLGTRMTLLSNSNNVEDWLPKSFKETKEYNWFLSHFPFESFVVISWEGCTVSTASDHPDAKDKIELFAQKLVPGQSIDNLGEWLNSQKIIADIDTSLVKDRLLPKTASATDPPSPEEAVAAPADLQVADSSEALTVSKDDKTKVQEYPQKDLFKTVLTYPRLKKLLMERYPDMSEDEVVERLSGTLIGPDGSSTALMAFLKTKPKGKEAVEVIERVKDVARELGIEPPKVVDTRAWYQKAADNFSEMVNEMLHGRKTSTAGVIIGGTPVDNASIGLEGERTLFRLAGFCALVGVVIAYICFQSIRLTTIVFWIAILSSGISLALVSFTGGRCDAIMLSMPALIYIMAMSGGIHLINYYHDAIREGGLRGAPERGVKLGWLPCLIAALTTAFGLASLCISDLIPIKKFGFYSALGVMGTLIMIFLLLPAMLDFFPSKRYALKFGGKGLDTEEAASKILLFWRWLGRIVIKRSALVAVCSLIFMLVLGAGIPKIKPEVKMMKFYSKDAPIIISYTWLEKHIGPLVPMEVVLKFDNATCPLTTIQKLRVVKKISEMLKTDHSGEIGGVLSATTMTPNPDPSETGGIFGRSTRLATETSQSVKIDAARPELKDYVAMELPEDSGVEKLEIDAKEVNWLKANGLGTISQLLKIPASQGTDRIPAERLTPYVAMAKEWEKAHGTDLWRISLRVWALGEHDIDYAELIGKIQEDVNLMLASDQIKNIADPKGDNINSDAAKGLNIGGVDAVYTGMVPLVYKTQHALIEGLRWSLITAFITIALVFCVVLKSPIAGFIAMVPNVFPVMVVFGFMGWRGILVDVGTMMTASVALGVAVDNTMHYLTWFRDSVNHGLKPKYAALEGYERCATAMTETTIIGGLGLAAFSFSTFTPTQMFGNMMLAILGVSIYGDLVFLPAVLTGRFGKYFLPKELRKNFDNQEDVEAILSDESTRSEEYNRKVHGDRFSGKEKDNVAAFVKLSPETQDYPVMDGHLINHKSREITPPPPHRPLTPPKTRHAHADAETPASRFNRRD